MKKEQYEEFYISYSGSRQRTLDFSRESIIHYVEKTIESEGEKSAFKGLKIYSNLRKNIDFDTLLKEQEDLESKDPVEPKRKIKRTPLLATHQQVRKAVATYIKHKKPFTYIIQNQTITVDCKYGSYTTRNTDYTIDDINFIKEVKQTIVKNGLHHQYIGERTKKVMYFKYSSQIRPGDDFRDCINIDLSAAYWETAYMLGLLSKDTYKRGFKVSKQVRLAAIGSLAKKKRVYEFDGRKQRLLDITRSETEFLWDVICDRVGDLLCRVADKCGDDFIFFWVDGIYVKKRSAKKVERLFNNAGYGFKSNPIKAVSVTKRNIFVHLINPEKKTKNGETIIKDVKSFPFRNKKISRQFKGYNRNL